MPKLLLLVVIFATRSACSLQPFADDPPAGWADDIRTTYWVDLSDAPRQLVRITMTLEQVESDTVELHLPVWRPGRYVVLDPAGTFVGLHQPCRLVGLVDAERLAFAIGG
ncbi:MAG: hypothetical protein AAF747_02190 [Planctomycetota bacterium]